MFILWVCGLWSHKIKLLMHSIYSLFSMRLIYYFDTWAIIWHSIVPVFLNICTDLQEICSIWAQNCFCYCFWTILGTQLPKLFRNNNKNNFALICCNFLANLCKSSEILKQYDVKWWLNYRKYGSVSLNSKYNLKGWWKRSDGSLCFSLLIYLLMYVRNIAITDHMCRT